MVIYRAVLYGLALLLLLAPLPFGAVESRWSAALVTACLALGILWVVWRCRRGLPALPWREPVLIASAAFALVAVAQMVPVPASTMEALSPTTASLRAEYQPGPAISRPLSLYPWATRQALFRFLACAIAALITLDLASTERARRVVIGALVASGVFQAAYGLGEFMSGRQHIFGYVKKYYADVATGTFINKNHYAGYLEMILPVALALAVTLFPRVRSSRHVPFLRRLAEVPGRDLFFAVMTLLLAVLIATAILSSQSRAGIASVLAALLVAGFVMALKGRRKGFAVAMALAAGVTLLLFSQGRGADVVERFMLTPESFGGEMGRWPIWTQAAGMAASFPLFGVGLGAFQHVFPAFRTVGAGIFLTHAHNDYLELLAEGGILGVVVFASGALLIGWSLVRAKGSRPDFGPFGLAAAAGILSLALHSLADFNLAIPANGLTFAVLVGLAVGWRRPAAPVLAVDQAPRRSWLLRPLGPAAVMGSVAVLAMAPVIAGARAEAEIDRPTPAPGTVEPGPGERVSRVLDRGNADRLFAEAARLGRRAVEDLQALHQARLQGLTTPVESLDYVRSRLQEALELQEQGILQAPTLSRGHLYRGHLRAAMCAAGSLGEGGEEDCAAAGGEDLRAALRLGPMSATTHSKVARFYIQAWPLMDSRARAEALPVIERAAGMNRADESLQSAWITARNELRAAGADREGVSR